MQLKPADSPELLRTVAGWLSEKENHQWLEFGDGRQVATPEWLKIAMQRGTHVMRVFTADDTDEPIGVAGFSNLNHRARTGTYWIVLGDKAHARRGYASRVTSRMLTFGFTELGLQSIQTWIVDHNPSIGVAERVGFRPIGRHRRCHVIDGQAYDRLWFDLLPSEHKEI